MTRLIPALLLSLLLPALAAGAGEGHDPIGKVTAQGSRLLVIDSRPFGITARTQFLLGGTDGKVLLKPDDLFIGAQVRYRPEKSRGTPPKLERVELLAD